MNRTDHGATSYLEHRPLLSPRQAFALSSGAALVLAVIGAGLAATAVIQRLELVTLDWRFRERGPLPVRRDIVIVQITETARRTLKRETQRFELREHLPVALNHLAEAGALVVGLDLWLEDLTDPQTDARLAEAIAQSNVIVAVTHDAGLTKRAPPLFLAAGPLEGDITVYPDPDGVLRRLPPEACLTIADESGTPRPIPQFAMVAALFGILERDPGAGVVCDASATRVGPHVLPAHALVDFAAVDMKAWRTLSFEEVVQNRFAPECVDGAIVLIGSTRAIEDSFPMSLSERLVPGVLYHANVIAQILDGRGFRKVWTDGPGHFGLVALVGLAAALFSWNPRPWWQYRRSTLWLVLYLGTGVVVFLGGWMTASCVLFERHILLPVAAPVTAMSLSLGTGLAAQWILLSGDMRRLAERARRIEAMFGQSVSHAVLQAVKADPQAIERTQVRDVSVLFCDLRGFTATSGSLAPEQVAALLNEYFNHITAAIFEHDGFIDKFVGDEVMAVFSVPLVQADHVQRAARTAVAIKRRLAELNQERLRRGEKPLVCGIGIHTGPAAAGHIGSRQRSNYTVVGNTVNLAARIEGFTKGGETLVSRAVRDQLPPDCPAQPWKEVDIRGSTGRHELYCIPDDPAPEA
jgi:adenylate cyclase